MWGNSTLALIFSSFSFFSPTPEPPSFVVETSFGNIEGISSTSRNGRIIHEFLGIPFAFPPTGHRRFKPPVPWNQTWDGVRDGTAYGARCTQYHLIARYLTGSEDCLFLNVYTHNFRRPGEPALPESDLKDAIVYIHGGFFMQGSSAFYKPKYFLDEDVVLVTINYRVGALGFLSLENDDIQGNMGLKDQTEALHWIKRDIRNFGGNPARITLVGESAGSVAVHLHLLSPMSAGLFHRAISQSGTALVAWGLRDHPFEQAKHFADHFNCSSESKSEIARCLRNLDTETIGRAHRDAANMLHHRYALFGPSVEANVSNTTERFLPDTPVNILKSGNFSKVPWICGANSEEGLLYAAPMVKNETVRNALNANWTYWAPIIFRFDDEPNKVAIANKIREHYFGNLSAEISFETLPDLIVFLTDRSFLEGIHHTLELHRGQHPIYPYLYSYRGQFSFGKLVLGMSFNLPVLADVFISSSWNWISDKLLRTEKINYGVAHGDELPLLFNMPFQKIHTEESPDYEMSKTLVSTWTRFAIDGEPPLIHGVSWPILSKHDQDFNQTDELRKVDTPIQFLLLNETISVVDDPFEARADFWKSLNMFPEREYYTTDVTENELAKD